jgi:DNA-binding transcriptional LysR family regulator
MVSRFCADYPQVQLIFRPHPDDGLKHAFTQEGIDLAFIVDAPLENPQFMSHPVIEESVFLVAHPSHHLAMQSALNLVDLADEPIFLTDVGCSYRKLFEDDLRQAGVHLTNPITFHSAEAIKQFVMAGAGLGVLPAIAVQNEIEHGRLVALDWHGEGLMTQLVWHKDKWLSPTIHAFIHTLQSYFNLTTIVA